jgi:hypothetical protein
VVVMVMVMVAMMVAVRVNFFESARKGAEGIAAAGVAVAVAVTVRATMAGEGVEVEVERIEGILGTTGIGTGMAPGLTELRGTELEEGGEITESENWNERGSRSRSAVGMLA